MPSSIPADYPPQRAPIVPGCLYFVATPIGNLEDITLRAIRVLGGVDTIAAEDTRTAQKLLSLLHIDKPLISLFEANEARRIPQLLERLRRGESIAVISEAGTPTLSDPGHPLNRACLEAKIPVDIIPGPSAVINALLLSGLSPARFRFLGFLPRKGNARRVLIEALATEKDTTVFYESPRRLAKTLGELAPLLGDRIVVITREMTKRHQEIVRGSAANLADRYRESPPRGEICVVIEGRLAGPIIPPDELERLILDRLRGGETPKGIAEALRSASLKRRDVYQLALHLARDLL